MRAAVSVGRCAKGGSSRLSWRLSRSWGPGAPWGTLTSRAGWEPAGHRQHTDGGALPTLCGQVTDPRLHRRLQAWPHGATGECRNADRDSTSAARQLPTLGCPTPQQGGVGTSWQAWASSATPHGHLRLSPETKPPNPSSSAPAEPALPSPPQVTKLE